MQSGFVPFRSSQIHYSSWGETNRVMLCFHGYGESSESFAFLARHLEAESYTLLAIDLPFHGQTNWKEGLIFTGDDLLEILEAMFIQLGIPGDSVHLLGYSLGGRIALGLLEMIPQRIGKILLVAPDGLRMNNWYWLATQTLVGNRLFRATIRHPGWMLGLLQLSHQCKLVSDAVFRFTTHFLQDEASRFSLYQRWTTLRKIRPNLPQIKSYIYENKIPVELLFGQFDPVIRFAAGERFCKAIQSHCRVTVIAAGHQLLQEKNSTLIFGLLKD